jgi:hypothetical protein
MVKAQGKQKHCVVDPRFKLSSYKCSSLFAPFYSRLIPIANFTTSNTLASTMQDPSNDDTTAASSPNEPTVATMVDARDTKSETSTICHEHEAFETFQCKVAVVAAQQLGRNVSGLLIERMKGGTYNRVVGVSVRVPKLKRTCTSWAHKFVCALLRKPARQVPDSYVVRIPRHDGEELQQQVATLKAVGSRLDLPIPEVVSYDLSSDNILEKPYMIQKRLPGKPVYQILQSLNLEQKKCLTRRLTKLVSRIATVQAAPGDISVDNLTSPCDDTVRTNKFPLPRKEVIPSTLQTSIDHLLEQCERWREFQTANGYCFENIWNGFVAISKSLEARGFLDGPCILVHGDFREYNLLAQVHSTTQVEITGIMDWDEALFAPIFMAYRAPFWLWTPEDSSSDTFEDEKNALSEPTAIEDQELKRVFLETASDDYKRFALAPEAILARRMYFLLRKGIFGPWNGQEAHAVISEWHDLHPEDGAASLDYSDSEDESDGESDDFDAQSEHAEYDEHSEDDS